ncbi:hypothetical protein Tco_0852687, partial [Tanacetum coccineum]
ASFGNRMALAKVVGMWYQIDNMMTKTVSNGALRKRASFGNRMALAKVVGMWYQIDNMMTKTVSNET